MKIIAAVLMLLSFSTLCYAGAGQTKNYRVSVTIPAVVGLNVKDPAFASTENSQDPKKQDIIKERVVRNNTPIILETIVLK